ncbi:unnamed protein product, partial [Candidula unifasciata]
HQQVQILQSGEKSDSASMRCENREHHVHYIEASDTAKLTKRLSQIPEIESNVLFQFIRCMCDLTALTELVIADGIRCGTCFVQKIEKFANTSCPCPECQGHRNTKWGKVTLTTALHVLKDEADASKCTVRFFIDSEDSTDQGKIIYGLKSHSRDVTGDWCALVCATHDLDLLTLLEDKLKEYWKLGRALKDKYQKESENLVVVVVSHPHGGPKRISLGEAKVKDLAREVREDQDWCYYSYDAVTCDGSSGAPVYVLGRWNDGFGYWFGHTHNHSGIDNFDLNSSTVGVDSTYGLSRQSYRSVVLEKTDGCGQSSFQKE